MTEVVTSSAAFSQLNLLAQRQQVFVVDRQSAPDSYSSDVAQVDSTQNIPKVNFADGQSTANQHQQEDASDPRNSSYGSGPSKARVEIKHLDLGLTPSEVVGTADVLQRFDQNGDGRVDLLESDRAGLARQKVFTFAGLAAAPGGNRRSAQDDVDPSALVPAPGAASTADAPVPAPAASPAPTLAVGPQAVVEKSFAPVDAAAPAPGTKKFADAAEVVAALGSPDNGVDAPRKFYGQGVEVVAGQFAAAAEAAPKYHDKVVVKDQVAVSEDGTGETKYYDKVAQSETGQPAGDQSGDDTAGAYYEKAQLIAAAGKKGLVVEVAVYADAAAAASGAPAEAVATTVVTA